MFPFMPTLKQIISSIAALLCLCLINIVVADPGSDSLLLSPEEGVMIVAHRGCWQHAPENSIKSIEDCIAMGIDMVELDVRMTRDRELVLMHDATINRTTTSKGKVRDIHYKNLQKLFLRNREGGKGNYVTNLKVPTLKEALTVAKDRILINLDAKENVRDEAFKLVQELGMERQVLIKTTAKPEDKKLNHMGFIGKTHYMPVIRESDNALSDLVLRYEQFNPVAYEVVLQDMGYLEEGVEAVQKSGNRLWVNTMYPDLCAGRDEINQSPDDSWGYFINMGVNMIQTDRPGDLIVYLKHKGLRQ